nr:hypothetical protein [uncultured bacterium]
MNTAADTLASTSPSLLARVCNRRFASNYLSTLAFIGLAYWIVSTLSNFHKSTLQAQWHLGTFGVDAVITVHAVFLTLIALYAVILIPYYVAYPWMRSSAFAFLQGAWFAVLRRRSRRPTAAPAHTSASLPIGVRLNRHTKQAGLALLLKFFFAPLMINWSLVHIANLSGSLMGLFHGIESGFTGRVLFDTSLFWVAMQLILLVDTLLFTLGYIIEVPALGNRIRSVEPTFFGWFICLICYPPFNDMTLRFQRLRPIRTESPLAVRTGGLVADRSFTWCEADVRRPTSDRRRRDDR